MLLLEYEFEKRFNDFGKMESDFTLFALAFKTNLNKASENLQIQLINLQCDINLKQKSQDVHVGNVE